MYAHTTSLRYKSWRIAKLDGGLAYSLSSKEDLPPTDQPFETYNGMPPAPTLIIHKGDPRLKTVNMNRHVGKNSDSEITEECDAACKLVQSRW